MDREAWRAVIHVVAKSQTQLSGWTELSYIFQGTEKIQNIREYINQLSNIFNIVTALTYFLNFKKY